MRRIVATGILCVFTLALTPASAEVPEDGVIEPGHNIGPAVLGMAGPAEEFVRAFGLPAKNPAPGFYVFSQSIGIAVGPDDNVHTIWIEQILSQ